MRPVLRIPALTVGAPLVARRFAVTARGPDVARLGKEIDIRRLPDPEEQNIDCVGLLAAACVHGMFSWESGPTSRPAATARRMSPTAPDEAIWELLLNDVDSGALRVLADMLAVLTLDSVEIADAEAGYQAASGAGAIAYPSCGTPQEFAFDYDRPFKSSGERAVRIGFAEEPDDEVLAFACDGLDVWGNLIMNGAYAADSRPGASGVFAEQASLEEPDVLGVSLPICKNMDELMFSPVVNLVRRIHKLHAPILRLEII